MSVLIKGMEIPKDCGSCMMQIYFANCGETLCTVTDKIIASGFETIHFEGRHKDCPLVEIPSPHDELIDKKNLYNDMKNALNDYCNTSESIAGARAMMNCLSSVPTIIDKESEA